MSRSFFLRSLRSVFALACFLVGGGYAEAATTANNYMPWTSIAPKTAQEKAALDQRIQACLNGPRGLSASITGTSATADASGLSQCMAQTYGIKYAEANIVEVPESEAFCSAASYQTHDGKPHNVAGQPLTGCSEDSFMGAVFNNQSLFVRKHGVCRHVAYASALSPSDQAVFLPLKTAEEWRSLHKDDATASFSPVPDIALTPCCPPAKITLCGKEMDVTWGTPGGVTTGSQDFIFKNGTAVAYSAVKCGTDGHWAIESIDGLCDSGYTGTDASDGGSGGCNSCDGGAHADGAGMSRNSCDKAESDSESDADSDSE